jgi:hypothetical protein
MELQTMPPAKSPRSSERTTEEFGRKLTALVQETENNGVDVTGGWDIETDSGFDYSVEIFPVVSE